MNRLGIEHISVFALPPVEYINLVADLGCANLSTAMTPFDFNPHGYPDYTLRNNPALIREMKAALRDRGVAISLVEGFFVWPGKDVRTEYAADLDVLVDLGVKRINSLALEPDMSRTYDQLGALAEMAAARGMETVIEFVPGCAVGDLPGAVTAVRKVGRRDFRICVDTMHVGRTGATAADLAAVDPAMIGYIQLCDVPLVSKEPSYMDEAKYQRTPPGKGELPLGDYLAALPRDLVVGIEMPLRREALAGQGPQERLRPSVEAARKLLAALDARAA